MKTCCACAQIKPPDEFYRWDGCCKACRRAKVAAYRAANAEKISAAKRLYYVANRQTMIDNALGRYAANKAIILKQTVNRHRRYRKERPDFRIRRRIGKRLAKVLRGESVKGWQAELGYDPALIVPHLESQFETWMTWGNYGTAWHIDHIRPVSSFELPAQIRECWALSNLRPLAATENLRKGAIWLGDH